MIINPINLAGINAQGWAKPEPTKKNGFIWLASYKDCEGKDSRNYTLTAAQTSDALCSQRSIVTTGGAFVANKPNGGKAIIGLSDLADSRYPDGGESPF